MKIKTDSFFINGSLEKKKLSKILTIFHFVNNKSILPFHCGSKLIKTGHSDFLTRDLRFLINIKLRKLISKGSKLKKKQFP